MSALWVGALSMAAVLGASATRTSAQAPPVAASPQAPAIRPTSTTGELHVHAVEPDGSRAIGVRFEVTAEGNVFRLHNLWSAIFYPGGEPASHERLAEPAVDATATFVDIVPGVPFLVRAVDFLGRELGSVSCSGLQAGESRGLEIPVLARQELTIRVLDDAGHPVTGVSVDLGGGVVSALFLPDWRDPSAARSCRNATTDEQGECRASEPIAPGPLEVSVWKDAWVDASVELSELPDNGGAVVIHLQPMHFVLVHAVDRNSRPVPLKGAILVGENGSVGAALPRDAAPDARSSASVETEWWRLPNVSEEAGRVRVFPLWGDETELPSSRDTIRAVLSTHIVLTVSWDEATAGKLGPTSALCLAEDKHNEHPMTDEERARHRADLALPIGHWTLRLQDVQGEQSAQDAIIAELPVDVRKDSAGPLELHAP